MGELIVAEIARLDENDADSTRLRHKRQETEVEIESENDLTTLVGHLQNLKVGGSS